MATVPWEFRTKTARADSGGCQIDLAVEQPEFAADIAFVGLDSGTGLVSF